MNSTRFKFKMDDKLHMYNVKKYRNATVRGNCASRV